MVISKGQWLLIGVTLGLLTGFVFSALVKVLLLIVLIGVVLFLLMQQRKELT